MAASAAAGPVRAGSEVSPLLCAFPWAGMGTLTGRQAFRQSGCWGMRPGLCGRPCPWYLAAARLGC